MKLEALQPNTVLRGRGSRRPGHAIAVQWFGSSAVEITYKTANGKVSQEILYRDAEPRLEIVEAGRPWRFGVDHRTQKNRHLGGFFVYYLPRMPQMFLGYRKPLILLASPRGFEPLLPP